MADQIMIGFRGEGSGSAPTTWGQREIWTVFAREGRSVNLTGRMPLGPGARVRDAAQILGYLMSRHPCLRTKFRFDDQGTPVEQVLEDSGEAALEIVDIDEEDPAERLEEHFALNDLTDFDSAADWPIRMTLLRHRGTLVYALAAYSHLAMDLHGLDVLLADLAARDPGAPPTAPPNSMTLNSMTPFEIAHWQQGPAARRQTRAGLRHWERLLRAVEPQRLPYRPDVPEPRYRKIIYTSPAAYRALWSVAGRLGTQTGPILLAAWACVLDRMTGAAPVVLQLVVNNRFRRALADSVSPVSQHGLCAIDAAGRPFGQVVAEAWRAQVQAGMNGYYDPAALTALVGDVERDRDAVLDIACYFNDRRRGSRLRSGPPPTADSSLRAALEHTSVVWETLNRPDDRLAIHIDDAPDTLRFLICADTHYLPADRMQACAQALEELLIEQALDPELRAVSPAPLASGVDELDHSSL
jgi:Condensation domain